MKFVSFKQEELHAMPPLFRPYLVTGPDVYRVAANTKPTPGEDNCRKMAASLSTTFSTTTPSACNA